MELEPSRQKKRQECLKRGTDGKGQCNMGVMVEGLGQLLQGAHDLPSCLFSLASVEVLFVWFPD